MATKPTKKTAKKPAPRKVAPAKVEETVVITGCGCGCGCRHGGFWRFVKKLIIFIIIFALGFAAAKFIPCPKKGKMMHRGMEPRAEMFVNGCLDIAKIRCPEMAQKIVAADANADGCITADEFRSFGKEIRSEMGEKPCMKDCGCKKCGCDRD